MKETTKTVFVAFDGTEFLERDNCVDYERNIWWRQLIGLTETALEAGLDRVNTGLADALEKAGRMIAAKRLKDGERRRPGRRPSATAPDDTGALANVEASPLISTNPEDQPEDEAA